MDWAGGRRRRKFDAGRRQRRLPHFSLTRGRNDAVFGRTRDMDRWDDNFGKTGLRVDVNRMPLHDIAGRGRPARHPATPLGLPEMNREMWGRGGSCLSWRDNSGVRRRVLHHIGRRVLEEGRTPCKSNGNGKEHQRKPLSQPC